MNNGYVHFKNIYMFKVNFKNIYMFKNVNLNFIFVIILNLIKINEILKLFYFWSFNSILFNLLKYGKTFIYVQVWYNIIQTLHIIFSVKLISTYICNNIFEMSQVNLYSFNTIKFYKNILIEVYIYFSNLIKTISSTFSIHSNCMKIYRCLRLYSVNMSLKVPNQSKKFKNMKKFSLNDQYFTQNPFESLKCITKNTYSFTRLIYQLTIKGLFIYIERFRYFYYMSHKVYRFCNSKLISVMTSQCSTVNLIYTVSNGYLLNQKIPDISKYTVIPYSHLQQLIKRKPLQNLVNATCYYYKIYIVIGLEFKRSKTFIIYINVIYKQRGYKRKHLYITASIMLSSIWTKILNLVLLPVETLNIYSSKCNISKYYHLKFSSGYFSCLKIYTITSIYKFTIMLSTELVLRDIKLTLLYEDG